jgi:uncharacterized protein (TIGR02246 family)
MLPTRPSQARRRLLATLPLAALGVPCAVHGKQGRPAQHAPTAADAAIRAANADWLPALRRADARALAAPYAADGLFVSSSGEVMRGRAAVEQLYAQRLAVMARVLGGQLQHEGSVQVSDDLVYEWGRGTLSVERHDGTRSTSGGPYLTVWQRTAQGRWQIIRNLVL